MQILLSNSQAGPDRKVKQEQEEILATTCQDIFSALYMCLHTSLLLNWVLHFNDGGACRFWRETISSNSEHRRREGARVRCGMFRSDKTKTFGKASLLFSRMVTQ